MLRRKAPIRMSRGNILMMFSFVYGLPGAGGVGGLLAAGGFGAVAGLDTGGFEPGACETGVLEIGGLVPGVDGLGLAGPGGSGLGSLPTFLAGGSSLGTPGAPGTKGLGLSKLSRPKSDDDEPSDMPELPLLIPLPSFLGNGSGARAVIWVTRVPNPEILNPITILLYLLAFERTPVRQQSSKIAINSMGLKIAI